MMTGKELRQMPHSSIYFSVRDLGGAHGSKAVKRELDTLPGVTSVSISQADRCIAVDFDPTGVDQDKIARRLAALGLEIDGIRDRFR